MRLQVLDQELSVCKVAEVPPAALEAGLCFIGKTDEELSLVCETTIVPADTLVREDGWRAMRIEGELDFPQRGFDVRGMTDRRHRLVTGQFLQQEKKLDRQIDAVFIPPGSQQVGQVFLRVCRDSQWRIVRQIIKFDRQIERNDQTGITMFHIAVCRLQWHGK